MTDRNLTVARLVTDHIDGIMIEGVQRVNVHRTTRQQEVKPMDDSKRERIEMNKRAARKQARQNDWSLQKMRVCPECGRTVLFSKNWVNEDPRQGTVYCTCEEYGAKMVPLEANQ